MDLAPTDKADESEIYSGALKYATDNPNVSNIALTGPYGSGKSSIIKTFLARYKRPVLQISLAAFLPEADGSVKTSDTVGRIPQKSAVSKQEIERSILQQMLYGADANSLPLSRFKRIQSPKWWSQLTSLFIVLGIFSCWYLSQETSRILSGDFFKPLDYTNWLNYTAFALGFAFLWQTLHRIYVKSFGLSLKSISLNDIEIAPEAAEEESILNRHLDEIIYFFQSTKYDLVVIEDLDRFNNPEIFVTLREINSLVNANAGVKRKIRFLYALRDNMFVNTDRTKFFEFIVPVIPIINSSNSIDKVIEQGERLSLDERLDRQFLREVSRHLNDLRLIQNIFNEYAVYIANLETDGENNLNANKLLAILIYKNVLPSDFEELHRGRGKLAEILNRHDDYVIAAENHYKAEISALEQKIDHAEKLVPSDLAELRKIYAMTLMGKISPSYTGIDFNGSRNIPIHTIWGYQEFDQIIQSSKVTCRSSQGHVQPIDISGLQKEVSADTTFLERKTQIERRSDEFKEVSSKTIRELRAKISTVRTRKFNEIIRSNANATEALFDAFGQDKDLVRFLVFEGFLDDTYYQYTSLFHSGRLSPNDNKYLIRIRSFNNPEPDFQIDNPKEVIAAMRDDDFRQPFVLNKILVDCMLSNQADYGPRVNKMVGFIAANFSSCEPFFAVYYERGRCVAELLTAMANKWPGFVSAAISSSHSAMHVAQMIAHLPSDHLKSLHQKDSSISAFVSSNLPEILALGVDFEPNRLALLHLEVKSLKSIGMYPAVARVLSEGGLYEISLENLEFILQGVLGSTAVGDLRIRNYSTILSVGDATVIAKVQEDFGRYLKNVLLGSASNTEEEVSAIIEVVNHHKIESEYLEQFIGMQSAKVPSLNQIPGRLHSTVFRLRKIDASWENCLAYMSSENFDGKTLTAFLQDDEVLSVLSQIVVDDQKGAQPLRNFLINNDDFDDDIFRSYIRALPNKFKQFPEGIGLNKLRILVEEDRIAFSDKSFDFLSEYEDLQILFVARNVDIYLADPGKTSLSDDFREKLLIGDIRDDRKMKIIELMDLTSLPGLADRASVIGRLFHRTNSTLDHLSAEVAQALIINSQPIATAISLFNKCQKTLSDEQVRSIIRQLPEPFSEIEPGWRQPTIPNTSENLTFVSWLQSRSIISSSKPSYFGDVIRIYNFRK